MNILSKEISDKILAITGINEKLLVKFIDRVEQFVFDIAAEMQIDGHSPEVMLGLAFAMEEASKDIVRVHKIVFADSS